ncbi:MAG: class II glutamine amidotransferase [Agrobacterium albertimagni]
MVKVMCELLGLCSNRRAAVSLSLARLAEHSGPPVLNGDGWGVAYYEGPDARLIKDSGPANESDWIGFLQRHDLRSAIVIAHIRHATMGARAYRNSQPFSRELAGRVHLFAHNGWLPGLPDAPKFRSARFVAVGETDSEQAFCALLDRLQEIWRPGEVPPLEERMQIVTAFAAELRSFGPANFLYSDGDALFAHGHRRKHAGAATAEPPGLVVLERECPPDMAGLATRGLSIAPDGQRVTLIASVPLTEDDWRPLAEGEVIALTQGTVTLRTSAASAVVAHGVGAFGCR